jgi:hypothetical protein
MLQIQTLNNLYAFYYFSIKITKIATNKHEKYFMMKSKCEFLIFISFKNYLSP